MSVRELTAREKARAGTSRKLRVFSVADAKSQPPRRYIVKGLIAPRGLSVIYGEPGCGKSFFVQHVGWQVASGRQVFGRRVNAGAVLYLALEGEGSFHDRVKGSAHERGTPEHFYYVAQGVNFYADQIAVDEVITVIRELGVVWLIVDTLARAMAEGDENTPSDMGKIITVLDNIREQTDAHATLVHHSGKDEARGMRGHSSLKGAADLSIHIKEDKDTGVRTAHVEKNKDGPGGALFAFALRSLPLGHDMDGDEVTTMVVDEQDVPTTRKTKGERLTADQQMWLEEIQSFIADQNPTPIAPRSGMQAQRAITRQDLMNHFRRKEMLGVTDGVTEDRHANRRQQDAARSKMQRILNALKAKKRLSFTSELVWLL